jgi:hypothetical protein
LVLSFEILLSMGMHMHSHPLQGVDDNLPLLRYLCPSCLVLVQNLDLEDSLKVDFIETYYNYLYQAFLFLLVQI